MADMIKDVFNTKLVTEKIPEKVPGIERKFPSPNDYLEKIFIKNKKLSKEDFETDGGNNDDSIPSDDDENQLMVVFRDTTNHTEKIGAKRKHDEVEEDGPSNIKRKQFSKLQDNDDLQVDGPSNPKKVKILF